MCIRDRDYLDDLIFYKENSSLESLDNENIKVLFQKALENSIAFSIIKRCGLNPNEYFTSSDFSDLLNFDSFDTITRIGVATSEISEMGLREIYNTCLLYTSRCVYETAYILVMELIHKKWVILDFQIQ